MSQNNAGHEEIRVVERQRRASVLTRPKLPCLAPYHTMNLSAGCPNECVYCYAQSYNHHPGWGTVAVYTNVLDKLLDEYPRMREKPRLVYFSTASEPFLPVKAVLDLLFQVMTFLLENGTRLLISTKCEVPQQFVELFQAHPTLVEAQIGITTIDDQVRQLLEPRAAPVDVRLRNLKSLHDHGVPCAARLDPLVPGLTDDDLSLNELFEALATRGIRRAVASFLFLRWRIKPPRGLAYGNWTFAEMKKLYTHKVTDYCGGGTIWLPPTEYRQRRLAEPRELARGHEVNVHLCGCKNKDITSDCCHPLPDRNQASARQLSFF
ncbi:radical SAM protein [Candidatus Sumerlaeota bacterium]